MCCTPLPLSVPFVTSFVVSMLPSPLLFSLCVFARGAWWDVCLLVFCLAPRARRASLFCVLLSCLVRVSGFPCCLLSLVVSCLVSSRLPCPAVSLCCVLVQLTLLCAGASLGVSGCSCDGSVALLHVGCMVLLCFPPVIRFMATKAFCPVWGSLLSTPCYW